MRIALAQFDATVGALAANVEVMLAWAARAREQGAQLVLFPELSVCGYPPRDLLDRPGFIRDVGIANERLTAELPADLVVVFGTVGPAPQPGLPLHNEAWVVQGGHCLARARKQLLPSYDVFDEARYFQPGAETTVLELWGQRVAVTICEDIWFDAPGIAGRYADSPLRDATARGANVVLNLSGSPFTLPKWRMRSELYRQLAERYRVSLAVTNAVGSNDELIFDGTSGAWSPAGEVLAQAPSFEESLCLVDLAGSSGTATATAAALPGNSSFAEREAGSVLFDALVLGVRDYARKCGFQRAVLGLSGGVDSALTAVIAARALGAQNVLGLAMPMRYSSPGSVLDARNLAHNLGLNYREIPVDSIFQAYLEALSDPLEELRPAGVGDATWENVQARVRGATVMAASNRTGALALTTGNKSELAVGYCTLYGDMCGGLCVIGDLFKTQVYDVARSVNERFATQWPGGPDVPRGGGRIPLSTLDKAPSAELRPNQTDQDSLPEYDLLDAVLERLLERQWSPAQIVADGFLDSEVTRIERLVRGAEHKRRQAAPALIVSAKAFAMGRRIPIAQKDAGLGSSL
jgi:NAD+ synthase (glutamine-hydrolysing)